MESAALGGAELVRDGGGHMVPLGAGLGAAGRGLARGGAERVRGGGVQMGPLGAGLRAVWPGLAAAMADAGQEALVVVPVDADSRRLGAAGVLRGAEGG